MAVRGLPVRVHLLHPQLHAQGDRRARHLPPPAQRRSRHGRAARGRRQRPRLKTIAFSDDIFAPPRPWLEEFCARYKAEIGLPFALYSFPRMVDDQRVQLMRDAGLWLGDDGHPVGLRADPPRLLRARDPQRGDHRGLRDPRAPRRRRATSTSSATTRTRREDDRARDRRPAVLASRSRSASTTSR